MTYVGVLCNVDVSADPREQLSPSVVNRAYILDELLAPADIRVFLYCPKDVTAGGEVPGFVLGQDAPAALRQPVPRVNANCSYSTRRLLRQGMRYQPFKKWMQERKNDVYVPYEFSELVSNKLKASDMVRAWNPAVHPLTEEFDGSREQLESFLGRSGVVFLKPRAGHKGNRIFVLRRQARGHALNYYDSGQIRCFTGVSLDTIVALVDAATGRDRYIVQEGIESLRCQEAVFDVRVVMVHDGQSWQSIFETRLAPRGQRPLQCLSGREHSSASGRAGVRGRRIREPRHRGAAARDLPRPGEALRVGLPGRAPRDRLRLRHRSRTAAARRGSER
jgi:hypothetical protein